MNENVLQIATTAADKECLVRIADELIARKLAACVQIIGPMESVYWWQGKVEHQLEWMCLAKTTQARYPEVERILRGMHPYELPEILATPVITGSAGYLNWIRETVTESVPE